MAEVWGNQIDDDGWNIAFSELENRDLSRELPFDPCNEEGITIYNLWNETYRLSSQELRWRYGSARQRRAFRPARYY